VGTAALAGRPGAQILIATVATAMLKLTAITPDGCRERNTPFLFVRDVESMDVFSGGSMWLSMQQWAITIHGSTEG
jgi:hypothetical protein